jgi:hypothetical protein
MSIGDKFARFCKNLDFSGDESQKIQERFDAICRRLNKDFSDMDTTHGGKFVGSVGRKTANSWESDIDMLFEMPFSVYYRYNSYNYNGQSALLQAVKNSILKTYSRTDIGGDGRIVSVSFDDMDFEVLPAFKNNLETYTYADSNGGGSWKTTNPDAEIQAISTGQSFTNNNLIHLCRMLRAWKRHNSAPLGGLLLDTFAYNFLTAWEYKTNSYLYYDWMTRDFFYYLKSISPYTTSWSAIGSHAILYQKGEFRAKAEAAYMNAKKAIEEESNSNSSLANAFWEEIYGARFTI